MNLDKNIYLARSGLKGHIKEYLALNMWLIQCSTVMMIVIW